MDIFSSSIDLSRIVFLLGAVLALLYKKRMGVTPGGIIVPGILAGILFTSFPAFLISIALGLVTLAIYRLAFGSYALTRRWSSLISISISVILGLLVTLLTDHFSPLGGQELLLFSLVIPGLLSISAQRYSIPKVFTGTLVVTALTCLGGLLASRAIPYEVLTNLSVQLAAYKPLVLSNPYFVLPISLAAAALIYYRFGIRGGGYLIAPFLAAVIASSPIQAALIAVGIALSYVTVRLIQKFTLVIGLERFVISLFCGYLAVTAMDLLAVHVGIGNYRPAPLVLIIAIAVITNDLTLQSVKKSLKNGITPAILISYVTRLAV